MKRKKFSKLNFDSDDNFHHYEDEEVGPCKPGNSFYNFLTKGSVPFKVPIPDTLTIGYGSGPSASSTVKLLTFDYRKDCLVTHVAQFDNQDQRDFFFNLCFDKFMTPQTYTFRQEEKDFYSGKSLHKAKVPDGVASQHKPSSAGTAGEDSEKETLDEERTDKMKAITTTEAPNHLKEDFFENAPLFNRFVGIQKKPATMSRFQASAGIGGAGDVPTTGKHTAKQQKHVMKGTSSSNNRERTVHASTAGKKYNRGYTHQHCETVLSFALHALLLELADRSRGEHSSDDNFAPYTIQRFVKSRGKRPSVYRIFWKNGSSLLAEGWNVAKADEEFVLPDLVLHHNTQVNLSGSPHKESSCEPQHRFGHKEDNAIVQKDEFNFQKSTTKYITNVLLLGKRKKEQELLELKEKELAKAALQQPANAHLAAPSLPAVASSSQQAQQAPAAATQSATVATATTPKKAIPGKPPMQRQDSTFSYNSDVMDHTFLTAANTQSNRRNSQSPPKKGSSATTAPHAASTTATHTVTDSPQKKNVLDFLEHKSTPELDEYFLRGMQSQVVMTSAERADALSINSKISHQYLDSITSSISNNSDGELSDAKLDKLIVTRVSHAALSTPIGYMTEIARWLSNTINSVYKLNIHIESMVCDFIKDDFGRWYLVNLKGYKIYQECIPRVRLWHHVSVLHRPESELVKVHSLTTKERKLKHEAEQGTECKLCGVHYEAFAKIRKQVKQLSPSILSTLAQEVKIPKLDPDEEVSVPAFGYRLTAMGAMVVSLAYHRHQLALTTYAQAMMAYYQLRFGANTRTALFSHSLQDGNTEPEGCLCCFYCQEIYQRYATVNQTHRKLYALLGCHPSSSSTESSSRSAASPQKVTGASSRLYANPALTLSFPAATSAHSHGDTAVEVLGRPKSATSIASRTRDSPLLRPRSAGSRPGSPSMHSTSMQSASSSSRQSAMRSQLPIAAFRDSPMFDFLQRVQQQHSQHSQHSQQGKLPAPKSSDTYISYHALPRNLSYFRMLLMTHCLIIDQHLTELKARNPHLPTHFCLVYHLGQQMHCLPFKLNDRDDDNRTIVIDFNPMNRAITMVPIQECRMHSLFANKASLLSYLREKTIAMKLFSATESTNFVFEGECSLSLHRLNLLENTSLLDGLTKEDEIIYFPSKSFGHVALKLSCAMNMVAAMPETFSNLLEVTQLSTKASSVGSEEHAAKKDLFYHEYEGIYWPSATFFPMMTSLPFAWMSMLMLTPNKMAFIDMLQQQEEAPPSADASPSLQHSAFRKKSLSINNNAAANQPKLVFQPPVHPAQRHRHQLHGGHRPDEDDDDDEEDNLLDMLDAELMKEERHIRKEIEQLKLKAHPHHTQPAAGHHHQHGDGEQQQQQQRSPSHDEPGSSRQQSLRRTLLRNSILMDQRLLAKTQQQHPNQHGSNATAAGSSPTKVSFSKDMHHDAAEQSRAVSPWQKLKLANSQKPATAPSSSNAAADQPHVGNSSAASSPATQPNAPSPGKRNQVIGQLYETLNIISTTKRLATKMTQKTKTANGVFKPSEFGQSHSMLPQHKPTAFQQFQAGIETLLNILEDKFHHEEEALLAIKKEKCKLRKRKADEQNPGNNGKKRKLRGIQEEDDDDDDEEEGEGKGEEEDSGEEEKEEDDEEDGSGSEVSDSDMASVDSLYPPDFHRFPGEEEEEQETKRVHVAHMAALGDDHEAIKLQTKTLRYLPPLLEQKKPNYSSATVSTPHHHKQHKHHHKHHMHNANRFEQYTYQPKASTSPDLPSALKPLCILPAYYILEELLGVVFEVKEMYTEFLQWQQLHPQARAEDFQPVVPTAMKAVSHRGSVLQLLNNRPTKAMLDAHHIKQRHAQEQQQAEHRELMKGTSLVTATAGTEDGSSMPLTAAEDVPVVRKRTYSSFVLPGSVASHLISGLQVNSSNPADLGALDDDDDDEDAFEVMIQANEWSHLHTDLLEGLSLAIKNLELFDYLPSHLNWTLCKPLLLENLQLFLAEKQM